LCWGFTKKEPLLGAVFSWLFQSRYRSNAYAVSKVSLHAVIALLFHQTVNIGFKAGALKIELA
jgi:hypothetical protein